MKVIRDLLKMFSVLLQWSRDGKRARNVVILVTVTGAIAGLGSPALIAIVNAALADKTSSRGGLLVAFAGLCIVIPLAGFASQALLVRLTAKSMYSFRLRLSRQILSARLRLLEELGAHRLVATFTDDIPTVIVALANLPLLFMQFAIVLGCLAYLGWLSWQLLLVIVGYMAVGVISNQIPMARSMHYFRLQREVWDTLLKSLRAVIEGSKELKLHRNRRHAFLERKLEPAADASQRYNVKANTIAFAAGNLGQTLFFVFIGLLIFGAPHVMNLESRALTGYCLTVLYLISPIGLILNTMPALGRAQVAAEKIEALGLSLAANQQDDGLDTEAAVAMSWDRIELRRVTHTYRLEDGIDDFTLGPLDLMLQPGELVFLIGGNGSGKTTLAKIITGLYEPESGEMRLNGNPVTPEGLDCYRNHFSAVFSDFYLFETLLGLDSPDLDARAQDLLVQLQLNRKVNIKDGELSTVELSQGQRKRLALLTAYLEDRPVYIFDEWAADQDPLFRGIFYNKILPDLKSRGKTVIVISHDERFYHLADRIIKLEHGQLEYDKRITDKVDFPFEVSTGQSATLA
ncbi:MAG TPA: cyclic peptide export ABC transporter [Blastocatellia bacterium]|nr:cyclic peptide export ABC transporter [Blastocatellia bacterium]